MERNENGFSERNPVRTPSRTDGCPGTSEPHGGGMATEVKDNGLDDRQLAMAYVPYQRWRMLYEPDKALARGTLFEELDKPLEDCVNG